MKQCLLVFVAAFLLASTLGAAPPQYDKYGGWSKLKGMKTGFFHTQQIKGRWWLVTPEGNVFISKACAISASKRKAGRRRPTSPPRAIGQEPSGNNCGSGVSIPWAVGPNRICTLLGWRTP